MKSMVLVMGFSRRVVPIRARSMVSGPEDGEEGCQPLGHLKWPVNSGRTPYKVRAVLERKQSRRQLSRADHRRKNDLAAVVDAIFRDWDTRRRGCHDACKCSKHPITGDLPITVCGDSGECESIIEKLKVLLGT